MGPKQVWKTLELKSHLHPCIFVQLVCLSVGLSAVYSHFLIYLSITLISCIHKVVSPLIPNANPNSLQLPTSNMFVNKIDKLPCLMPEKKTRRVVQIGSRRAKVFLAVYLASFCLSSTFSFVLLNKNLNFAISEKSGPRTRNPEFRNQYSSRFHHFDLILNL